MTKNMKYRNALRAYEMGCEQVAEAFVKQYFPGHEWCFSLDKNVIFVGGLYEFQMFDVTVALEELPHLSELEEWRIFSHECPITLSVFLKLKKPTDD